MRTVSAPVSILPPQGSRHLMAFDLAKFIRRSWHGHVNDRRDEPERVVPTALRRIALLLRGRQPTHVVFADDGSLLHRLKIFDGYKAGRPPKPQALLDAEHRIRNVLAIAGVVPWRVQGLEADDVLHASVIYGAAIEIPVVIVTDDKDADQLVSGSRETVVWDGDERVFDEASVRDNWGVEPAIVPDVLALAGDTTDGVPGVRGWGPKTAARILHAAAPHTLRELLRDGGHWYVPEKWRTKFIEQRATIKMSLDLVTLRGDWLIARGFGAAEVDPLRVASALLDESER